MTKSFEPAENDPPQVPSASADGHDDTRDDLNGETTRDDEREQHTIGSADETRATPRSRRRRSTRAARSEGQPNATPGGILQLPVRGEAQPAERPDGNVKSGNGAESDEAVAVAELEARGFTPDEAIRLVHVSDRVATSREAREAEATLRRLRFTRWLIERGMLDEFSA